ncbi:MAG: AAA family ATPase [Candidatus Thiodiazotropha sp. (ex Lucinoma borealis)]|nr:AAA family ATPase [Candidatus Thiodiazotropha sp. (ex Lucinoma borealis)]
MADTKSLYLPLSNETLTTVLEEYPVIGDRLCALSGPELSALCVLQKLPDLQMERRPTLEIERLLAKLIVVSHEEADNNNQHGFSHEVEGQLNSENLRAGLAVMCELGVDLLDQDEVKACKYLQSDGRWDYNFTRNQQATPISTEDPHYQIPGLPDGTVLTSEQFRIPQTLDAQIDDHLHIQGYAGTGKSHLINVIIDLLVSRGIKPCSILVLARTFEQLKALTEKLPSSITGLTYNNLITKVIPKGLLDKISARLRSRSNRTDQLYPEHIASLFGLTGIGGTSAYTIARASKGALYTYCQSGDDAVMSDHLPKWFKVEIAKQKTAADSAALEAVAISTTDSLWQETLNPTNKDFEPPVRGYHQIKYAALHSLSIPKYYSHVIIDESHDLSQAMLQILDNSLPACVTLGDDYQNLTGRPSYREKKTREKNIFQSYRAGHQLESIINPIITTHPVEPKELFVGSDDIKTTVEFYQKPTIPEQIATILVSDYWAMWAWADHMLQKKVRFTLYGTLGDLNLFVHDCIELKTQGTRPRHGNLFHYRTWDQLAENLDENRGFRRVHKLLQDGYSTKNWETTQDWIGSSPVRGYALSTLEAAKNREFDVVMLGPDTADMIRTADRYDKNTKGAVRAALYIGATRVRQKLIAPNSLRNWIEETSATFR